jgi:hypothetical protein
MRIAVFAAASMLAMAPVAYGQTDTGSQGGASMSMTVEIRRKTPMFRNLARDLLKPNSTVERMVARRWDH